MRSEKAMYEERTYRRVSKPENLVCYEVVCKETDLFCCTSTELKAFIEERTLFYRNQLETYIRQRPEFQDSLAPLPADSLAPRIVREMLEASAVLGVGPMACVAGAVAEFIGRDVEPRSDEYIIENGGDIFLRTLRERKVSIYAKDSPYSGRIGIKLQPGQGAYGVCTSSATVGPSLSFGRADAVCVVGRSSLFSDGLATRLGNIVHKEDDIGSALEEGRAFPGVTAIVIILGKRLGVWGDVDLISM
ncbi:MAG: UPF0280 family protein [Syntrophorhabdales bacterium]|jgi:ApbE superfamily uncharacterized protein (UPF0280 family)